MSKPFVLVRMFTCEPFGENPGSATAPNPPPPMFHVYLEQSMSH